MRRARLIISFEGAGLILCCEAAPAEPAARDPCGPAGSAGDFCHEWGKTCDFLAGSTLPRKQQTQVIQLFCFCAVRCVSRRACVSYMWLSYRYLGAESSAEKVSEGKAADAGYPVFFQCFCAERLPQCPSIYRHGPIARRVR
jgi:hypothetical protein